MSSFLQPMLFRSPTANTSGVYSAHQVDNIFHFPARLCTFFKLFPTSDLDSNLTSHLYILLSLMFWCPWHTTPTITCWSSAWVHKPALDAIHSDHPWWHKLCNQRCNCLNLELPPIQIHQFDRRFHQLSSLIRSAFESWFRIHPLYIVVHVCPRCSSIFPARMISSLDWSWNNVFVKDGNGGVSAEWI